MGPAQRRVWTMDSSYRGAWSCSELGKPTNILTGLLSLASIVKLTQIRRRKITNKSLGIFFYYYIFLCKPRSMNFVKIFHYFPCWFQKLKQKYIFFIFCWITQLEYNRARPKPAWSQKRMEKTIKNSIINKRRMEKKIKINVWRCY